MQDSLKVQVDAKNVGTLYKEEDKYIFSYRDKDKDVDFISLTMPVRTQQYLNSKLHPIFEMHLPEGYLLSIIKKHFSKLTKTDDFGLLKLMAKGMRGRVSYESKTDKKENSLSLEDILNPSSENLFDELVQRFALNSSLSGVQPKVLATLKDKATLRYDEYIVKSWGEEYPQLALNEYYCMNILKYANINLPEYYISSDEKLFIMKRFDIKEDGSCIGFEDMCVLQAKQRDDKYEGSYEQVAKTIKTFVSAKNKKSSLIQFYKMVVINNIVQNGDAHLKNFGLVYTDIQDIKIAPAYDVVSTTLYIKNDIPALHLLGSKKWLDRKNLIKFGIESCELSNKEANKFYDQSLIGVKKVKQEIIVRMKTEIQEDKLMVLHHLLTLLVHKPQ